MTLATPRAHFAAEPPEARGLRRDDVRLLVSHLDGRIEHLRFHQLPSVLNAGDLLVVNASRTVNASIAAERTYGMRVELHVSTMLAGGLTVVEVRQSDPRGSKPLRVSMAGELLILPAGGRASLLAPYPFTSDLMAPSRLWTAALELPMPLLEYLDAHGSPVRYDYVPRPWPLASYQTVFATESGSAEMPSAGRPFSVELVEDLLAAGIRVAPILLHTGLSSLEDREPPYEERFRVPRATANDVNATRAAGHRVIAVGTTVVRALETVTDELGVTHPGDGWTDLVITPDRPLRSIDGLLTGFHEPKATHLSLVRAAARGREDASVCVIERAYREAAERGYLWHEFGDSHLLLQ
jgi:S-adenosylmethionine:tRNA ribosyltransferase-isomerase